MSSQAYYAFVDGAYLRNNTKQVVNDEFRNPRTVVTSVANHAGFRAGYYDLERLLYFDAIPDPDDEASEGTVKAQTGTPDATLRRYFEAIEKLPDTELRYGWVRGRPDGKQRRQKGVDIHLAVDMLAAATDKLFRMAFLISGDADFVPLVYEVKRRGVRVVVAGFEDTTSELLSTSADRYIPLKQEHLGGQFDF